MIVGEAPGREEVEAGRPFVGRSGKLLETALRAVGVAREEVYITNVVKEWPRDSEGKTRRPYDEEVAAWREVLEGEILNTAPVAILALGRVATRALIPFEIVGDEAPPFGSKIGNVYTAWHPSYVLRNGGLTAPIGLQIIGGVAGDWLAQIRPWAEALLAA